MKASDRLKCGSWPLGRIERVQPCQDGIVCVVDVCCEHQNGCFQETSCDYIPGEAFHANKSPKGAGDSTLDERNTM